MPQRFSVTDYRKQRNRKSRLQKQKEAKTSRLKTNTSYFMEVKFSGERHTLSFWMQENKTDLGSLPYMLGSKSPQKQNKNFWLYFRASSGLATEGLQNGDELSTASTVSRPKCSDENRSDSETTNQLLHLKLVTETELTEDCHVNSLLVPSGQYHTWNWQLNPLFITLACIMARYRKQRNDDYGKTKACKIYKYMSNVWFEYSKPKQIS